MSEVYGPDSLLAIRKKTNTFINYKLVSYKSQTKQEECKRHDYCRDYEAERGAPDRGAKVKAVWRIVGRFVKKVLNTVTLAGGGLAPIPE